MSDTETKVLEYLGCHKTTKLEHTLTRRRPVFSEIRFGGSEAEVEITLATDEGIYVRGQRTTC